MLNRLPSEILVVVIELAVEAERGGGGEGRLGKRRYEVGRLRLVCREWAELLVDRTFGSMKLTGSNQAQACCEWLKVNRGLRVKSMLISGVGSVNDSRNSKQNIKFELLDEILSKLEIGLKSLRIEFDEYEELPMRLMKRFLKMKDLIKFELISNANDSSLKSNSITFSLLKSIICFSNLRSLHLKNYLHNLKPFQFHHSQAFPAIHHLQFDGQVNSNLILHLLHALKSTLKSISLQGPFISGELLIYFQSLQDSLQELELSNVRLTPDELRISMKHLRSVKFRGYSHAISTLHEPFYENLSCLEIDTLPFDQLFDLNSFRPSSNLKQIKIIYPSNPSTKIREYNLSQFLLQCQTFQISIFDLSSS